jgi:thiamine-phosphate pyrophosphorylase
MQFTETHNSRMKRFLRAGLYLVTSETLSGGRSTRQIVAAALQGGTKLLQLREKGLSGRAFFELALDVRRMTAEADALLIINDRLDIALAAGADGVHLGQDDLPVERARRLAPDLIIGASSHSVEEARRAEELGASYVNIGPLFPTTTKEWTAEFLGLEGLKRIAPSVRIPFTVMGGIKKEHIPALRDAGARTIALVTAVTRAPDPRRAAADLLAAIRATAAPGRT